MKIETIFCISFPDSVLSTTYLSFLASLNGNPLSISSYRQQRYIILHLVYRKPFVLKKPNPKEVGRKCIKTQQNATQHQSYFTNFPHRTVSFITEKQEKRSADFGKMNFWLLGILDCLVFFVLILGNWAFQYFCHLES